MGNTDWQPIETAPKDDAQEERLLGYSPTEGVRIIRYSGWGNGSGPFEHETQLGDGYVLWFDLPDLTHWMPLPTPPESKPNYYVSDGHEDENELASVPGGIK